MSAFSDHLALTATDRDGRRTWGVVTDARHANTMGAVHGGLLASLLDTAMGQAVFSALPQGWTTVTVSMTVTYLNGARIGDALDAVAEVRKQSSSIALVEADIVRRADGRNIAHAVATYALRPPPEQG